MGQAVCEGFAEYFPVGLYVFAEVECAADFPQYTENKDGDCLDRMAGEVSFVHQRGQDGF